MRSSALSHVLLIKDKLRDLLNAGKEEEARECIRNDRHVKNKQELPLSLGTINTPEELSLLGAALRGTPVKTVSLNFNGINTPTALSAFGTSLQGASVEVVGLAYNGINTPAALSALGVSLKDTSVKQLDLEGNKINTPEALAALGTSLINTSVKRLYLANNGIHTVDTLIALVISLRGTCVEELYLDGNTINMPEALAALGTSLINTSVKRLYLANNGIHAVDAIIALATSLRGTCVEELYLDDNKINTPEALAALGTSLINTSINRLYLANNGIHAVDAVIALVTSLRGTLVQALCLDDYGIRTREAQTALSTSLKGTSIRKLYIGLVYFEGRNDGWAQFGRIKENVQDFDSILEILKENQQIIELDEVASKWCDNPSAPNNRSVLAIKAQLMQNREAAEKAKLRKVQKNTSPENNNNVPPNLPATPISDEERRLQARVDAMVRESLKKVQEKYLGMAQAEYERQLQHYTRLGKATFAKQLQDAQTVFAQTMQQAISTINQQWEAQLADARAVFAGILQKHQVTAETKWNRRLERKVHAALEKQLGAGLQAKIASMLEDQQYVKELQNLQQTAFNRIEVRQASIGTEMVHMQQTLDPLSKEYQNRQLVLRQQQELQSQPAVGAFTNWVEAALTAKFLGAFSAFSMLVEGKHTGGKKVVSLGADVLGGLASGVPVIGPVIGSLISFGINETAGAVVDKKQAKAQENVVAGVIRLEDLTKIAELIARRLGQGYKDYIVSNNITPQTAAEKGKEAADIVFSAMQAGALLPLASKTADEKARHLAGLVEQEAAKTKGKKGGLFATPVVATVAAPASPASVQHVTVLTTQTKQLEQRHEVENTMLRNQLEQQQKQLQTQQKQLEAQQKELDAQKEQVKRFAAMMERFEKMGVDPAKVMGVHAQQAFGASNQNGGKTPPK